MKRRNPPRRSSLPQGPAVPRPSGASHGWSSLCARTRRLVPRRQATLGQVTLGIVMLGLVSGMASAQIYKYEDENGQVVFSDERHPDAEVIQPANTNRYSAPPTQGRLPSRTGQSQSDDAPPRYEAVTIREPAADAAFWDAAGVVPVTISVQPALFPGHKLELLLDGAPVAAASGSLRYSLQAIERGTHTLVARVLNEKGTAVKSSSPSQFTLHKPSRLN